MGRWEPNSPGRLEEAAMELYLERGFDQTTVADIAARAGLTERTFFRHYSDKREVLFAGSTAFQAMLVDGVAAAEPGASPIGAVSRALQDAGALFQQDPAHSRQRWAVISANRELQERELIKMAGLAVALAGALRARGVPEPVASLTAEAGVAVFRIAYEQWVGSDDALDLPTLIRDDLVHLHTATRGH